MFVSAIDCRNPLDLVFLVDDSSSIRQTEWPEVLQFLMAVARRIDVSPVTTRIGIVRYATTASVLYRLTSTQTQNALISSISSIVHIGGSTNLAAAMALAYQQVFLPAQRPGAAKVCCFNLLRHITVTLMLIRTCCAVCLFVCLSGA